ncbi:MAG: efflux RND transporter periplasmic adaptor subunit [Muribaculaceae bacterium]|nr:efflux RND transporter periplasmic adaptor subunit [Muribaculaceae bacterium]
MTPKKTLFPALLLTLVAASCSKQPTMELQTYTVEPTTMSETVTATGTMESVTSVDVGTQVTGIIDKLYADFNDVVTKGQLLAELEKTTLDAELKSSDANVQSAKSTYEYTEQNYKRNRTLHDENLISDYEYQTSLHEYQVAKLNYEKAQADRVRAAKNLNYTEIYSPIDGVVISREVEVGQTVVSSMNVANLYVIADLDNMQVVGNVDEADIGKVKEGQHVTFTVDAYTDDVFEGTVTQVRLNPTTTSNVVTYEVIVAAANPDHKLIPGMTANLTIYTLELKDIFAVPLRALRFSPETAGDDGKDSEEKGISVVPLRKDVKNRVWVLREDRLVETAVELGVNNGITQQVTAGLKRGDKVALQYHMAEPKSEGAKAQENPFMPKPPGANRNKK